MRTVDCDWGGGNAAATPPEGVNTKKNEHKGQVNEDGYLSWGMD